MQFTYKARDKDGNVIIGEIEGASEKAAKMQLAERGLFPMSVGNKGTSFDFSSILQGRKKIKPKDIIAFTRQFGVLFKAGVAIEKILSALAEQARTPALKEVIGTIKKDVSGGASLFNAFRQHPSVFNELYVNMMNVGEQSGSLDQSLVSLAKVMERDYRIVARIKSATLYPKIVLVVFFAVAAVMMIFVVPQFASFYSGYGAELPVPTKIMIAISDIFVNYWYMALAVIGGLVFGFKKYVNTPRGRFQFDNLRFKLPVFGNLNLMVSNARFGHLVGVMYGSGLPLSRTLDIVSNAIGNRAYGREIEKVRDSVEGGTSLANAMRGTRFFTPLMVETTAVGEQSGSLEEMLETTSGFYDEEVSDILDKLATLIEPLLLVGLFGMVALLAFAVFLPMWNVSKVVLPH